MKRYMYAFASLDAACAAVAELRKDGIAEYRMTLLGPERRQPADLLPEPCLGAAAGAGMGLLAGIASMSMLPLSFAVGASMLLGFVAAGAVLGAWTATPLSVDVPLAEDAEFDAEIAAGCAVLLVYVDSSDEAAIVARAMRCVGGDEHLQWRCGKYTPAIS